MATTFNGTPDLPITVSEYVAPVNTNNKELDKSKKDGIIRQVEYYFSEENLPHDVHLLGCLREGNGTVSLKRISGFKMMRKFKPMGDIRAALQESTLLELCDEGKRLRRRTPLKSPITVTPRMKDQPQPGLVAKDEPWMTKAMRKPTGFEENPDNKPREPEETEEERKDYHPDVPFVDRIETAITRFRARRKMHQEANKTFSAFLVFGGFRGGQPQFSGGWSEKSTEDHSKKELAEMNSHWSVVDEVRLTLGDDDPTWVVDFEDLAKGFLSSQFLSFFIWEDSEVRKTAIGVLRNFYNYLLCHDVCPEYREQIVAARKVCDIAEGELPKLRQASHGLPGDFDKACSTLFGGYFSGLHATGDWVDAEDNLGWADDDAAVVFKAGVFAHGTDDQLSALQKAPTELQKAFRVTFSRLIGLEVVGMEMATGDAKEFYDSSELTDTIVKPLGKLRCVLWKAPHATVYDLPAHVIEAEERELQQKKEFVFLVGESALQACYPGLKMEAEVKQLDLGFMWIDRVEATYPSFFVWLTNENIRDWKTPGPPRKQVEAVNGVGGDEEAPEDGLEDFDD